MSDRVARRLQDFALEVRQLAYQVPAGQGEFALLQLSQRMAAEAGLWLRTDRPAIEQVPTATA